MTRKNFQGDRAGFLGQFIRVSLPLITLGFLLPACGPPAYQFDESAAVHQNFSGDSAFEYVRAIAEMGPRPAGSEAIEKSRPVIEKILREAGWQVRRQSFRERTPAGEIEFVNLRARFGPEDNEALWEKRAEVLVASHYDTKKFGGFEFVGANDPASSVGALLHIAEVVAAKPDLAGRLELVFFDGEEAFGTSITDNDGLYGSTHYAAQYVTVPEERRPRSGVLLDMIGDRNLNIRAGVEVSPPPIRVAPEITIDHRKVKELREQIARDLIAASEELGYRNFFGISNSYINDDHVPLNQVPGIPTIDVIDFDYQYWHTPADKLDKLSPESLEIVGKTVLLLIEKYLLAEE